jgi:hypothetical protein
VHDRLLVDVIDGGQGALREFLFGDDAYVAQHGAGELGEEALDEGPPTQSPLCFEAAIVSRTRSPSSQRARAKVDEGPFAGLNATRRKLTQVRG